MATKPTEAALTVLKACTVEGNIIKLPKEILQRDVYVEVKKHLELIGGKWKGGKTQGFVYEDCNADLLQELLDAQANGDVRNLKKEFQFFATPADLAREMVSKITFAINEKTRILEPSAGDGALVKAFLKYHPGFTVDCFELMEINRVKLQKVKGANILGNDFIEAVEIDTHNVIHGQYDIIIANPPFNKNQDIDHIQAMYRCLKPNGRIVTIASPSWTFGSQKKQVDFRNWLQSISAYQEELPEGTFGESGTEIRTMLLVIDKLEIVRKIPAPAVIKDPITVIGTSELSTPNKNNSMKKIIIIPTSPFVAILKKVKEVIDKNPILNLLDNILIKVMRNDIQVIATDLLVTVIADIEITNDGDHGYEFLLPFKFLHDTMMLINDSAVTIEYLEKSKKEDGKTIKYHTAMLTTFSDTYDLQWLDKTDEWPKLPEFPRENSIGIADGFIEWLNLMIETCDTDKARPAMQKILIAISNNGIAMASTNAYVLVEKAFQCESEHTIDMLVNTKIAKALKGFKQTSVSWSDTHIAFVSANMTLIGTIQDEKYPDYKPFFHNEKPNLSVSLTELTGVMQKVSLTKKLANVYFKREIGRIVVESFDADYNRMVTVRIAADYAGQCEKIIIDPEQLLTLLGQVKYVNLQLCITEFNKAVIITTDSDNSYRSLIMPSA